MKKKTNIKLIVISVILICLAILFLYLFLKTDFFRTKRSAFIRYFEEIPSYFEILKFDEFSKYKEKKEEVPYIRNANIQIQSSSNVADTNILDKIKFTINEKTNNKTDLSNIEFKIYNSGNNLFTLNGIKDKDVYGLFSDEIAKKYICVKNENLKRILLDTGIEAENFPNKIQIYDFKDILETTSIEKKKINECLDILKNDVPQSAYLKTTKKIKINDKTYSTKCYTLKLNENESKQLQIDLLNKISNDSFLMDYISSKATLLNLNEKYTDINNLKSIIKERTESISSGNEKIDNVTISVYENKQKNIRTEINCGKDTIVITHLNEDQEELLSIQVNNQITSIKRSTDKYILKYENNTDIPTSITIEYNQTGTIEENNIKNLMTITTTEGIKSVTYKYTDTIEFTENTGTLNTFKEDEKVILNDYDDEQISGFIGNLKEKINLLYVSKGASIGINLDPLFK